MDPLLLKKLEEDLLAIDLNEDHEDDDDDDQTNHYFQDRKEEISSNNVEDDPDWILFQKGINEIGTSILSDMPLTARENQTGSTETGNTLLDSSLYPKPKEIPNDVDHSIRLELNPAVDESGHRLEIIELLDGLIESIEYLAILTAQEAPPRTVDIPEEHPIIPMPDMKIAEFDEDQILAETNPENHPPVEQQILESEELLNQQRALKKSSEEIENLYELKLREEHVQHQREKEQELREIQLRKQRKQELWKQAQRENKAILIQKYFRRHVLRKRYLYWKRQIMLEREQLEKRLELEREEKEKLSMTTEDRLSRSYSLALKRKEIEQERHRHVCANMIGKHWRGMIVRIRIVPLKRQERELKSMKDEDFLSEVTIARLPVVKREQDKVISSNKEETVSFLPIDDPKYLEQQRECYQSFDYQSIRLRDSQRLELVKENILSKRVIFPYILDGRVAKVTPRLVQNKTTTSTPVNSSLSSLFQWQQACENLGTLKAATKEDELTTTSDPNTILAFQRFYQKQFQAAKRDSSGQQEIESLDLAVEGLSDITFLSDYPALKRLVLNVNQIQSLDLLQSLISLRQLLIFSISDNKLTDLSPLNQPNFQTLLSLNVDSNRLQYIDLHHLTSLHFFSANCNQLKAFPRLQSKYLSKIELYNNNITQISSQELRGLPALLSLNLGKNGLIKLGSLEETVEEGGGGGEEDQWYRWIPLLQTLILSQNQLTTFPRSIQLPCLLSLWLNGNRLTRLCENDAKERHIFLPQLRKLYLQDNQLQDLRQGNDRIANLFDEFPLLLELDVSFNQIQTLEAITVIKSAGRLQNLKINDNPLCQRLATNTVSMTPALTFPQIITWCQDTFPFLTSLNGEVLPPRMNISRQKSSPPSYSMRLSSNSVAQKYAQLLQCLQQCKMEYDETMFRIRKKSLKKLSSPLEESLQQLQYDVSMVYLAFTQKERLLALFHKTPSPQSMDSLLIFTLPPPLPTTSSEDERGKDSTIVSTKTFASMIPSFASQSLMKLLTESIAEVKKEEEVNQCRSSQSSSSREDQKVQLEHQRLSRLQACWRGYRLRKKVRQYLSNITYEDDELASILNDHPLEAVGEGEKDIFDLSDLEAFEKELEATPQSKLTSQSMKLPPSTSLSFPADIQPSFTTRSSDGKLEDRSNLPPVVPSLAYGDHIRKRGNLPLVSAIAAHSEAHEDHVGESHEPGMTTPRSSYSAASSAKTISEAGSLPSSASALAAAHAMSSLHSNYPYKSPRQLKEATAVAEDWGIADPKVLATLMKRNHRIKNFLQAKENREKEKDSTVRYQKFLKQQAKPPVVANHRESAGGGGGRGIRRIGRNGKGKGVRDHLVIPAWMAGGGGDKAETVENNEGNEDDC